MGRFRNPHWVENTSAGVPVFRLIATLRRQTLAEPVAHKPIVISERDHLGKLLIKAPLTRRVTTLNSLLGERMDQNCVDRH